MKHFFVPFVVFCLFFFTYNKNTNSFSFNEKSSLLNVKIVGSSSGVLKWNDMITRSIHSKIGFPVIKNITDVDLITIIRVINNLVNEYDYQSDMKNYNRIDYWASPYEFLEKQSGDCEDYAIFKYFLLRSSGFSAKDMRIAIVWDVKLNSYHAVLLVWIKDEVYVLDNLKSDIVTVDDVPNYIAQGHINEDYVWR